MINIKTSRDFRAKIQNGFWGFKLLILIGLVIASFFIPNDGFAQTLMIIGLIGGFLVSKHIHIYLKVAFLFFNSLFSFNYFWELILYIRKFLNYV